MIELMNLMKMLMQKYEGKLLENSSCRKRKEKKEMQKRLNLWKANTLREKEFSL
jgi:hypothetical protein